MEAKRDGMSSSGMYYVEMDEQTKLPEIRFDEWTATPAGTRQALLGLRAVAAKADKWLAWLESNPKKIQERLPQYCNEVTNAKILESLSDVASAAQSYVLNDHDSSLPDSVRKVLLVIITLNTEANWIRQMLPGLNPDPAGEGEFLSAVSVLTRSLRVVADGVAPLYTLLVRLNDDPECAAESLEKLKNDLICCLAHWGSPLSDFHADLALDRVIRRIEEGEEVRNITLFSRAVAWKVWQEYLRKIPDKLPEEIAGKTSELEDLEAENQQRYDCMRECLAKQPPETRWLIREYAHPERKGREKITHREKLACMLDISPGKLRSRIFNLRGKLLNCLNECLNK